MRHLLTALALTAALTACGKADKPSTAGTSASGEPVTLLLAPEDLLTVRSQSARQRPGDHRLDPAGAPRRPARRSGRRW